MKKLLDYIIINYEENDKEFINNLSNNINDKCKEIIDFFEIKKFEEKVKVKIFNDILEFRKYYKEKFKKEPQDWVNGFVDDKGINCLNLEECKKTYNHENSTIEDIEKLIIHEFTHSVQFKRNEKNNIRWLTEGLATFLSNQYNDCKLTVSYDDIMNNVCSYTNYKAMVIYAYSTYGKEYILKLVDDKEYLLKESKKIYDECYESTNN